MAPPSNPEGLYARLRRPFHSSSAVVVTSREARALPKGMEGPVEKEMLKYICWRRTMMEALLVAIPLVLILQWGLGSPPWEAANARPLDSLFEDAAKGANGFDWNNITKGEQSYPTDLCEKFIDPDRDMCLTLFCSEKLFEKDSTIGTTTGNYWTELCMAEATVGVCDASCRNVTNNTAFGNEGNKLLVYDTATAVREALDAFVYTPEFRDVNSMLEWSKGLSLIWQFLLIARARMRWNEWGQSRQSLAVAWLIPFLFTLLRFCIPLYKVMSMDTGKLVDEMMERLNLKQTSQVFAAIIDYYATYIYWLISPENSYYSVDDDAPDVVKKILTMADYMQGSFEDVLDFSKVATGEMLRLFALIYYAFKSVSATAPLVLGLLPGIGKGSLVAKAIVPHLSIPGWLAFIVPWLQAPLLLTVGVIIVQLFGSYFLMVSVVAGSASLLCVPGFGSRAVTRCYGDTASLMHAIKHNSTGKLLKIGKYVLLSVTLGTFVVFAFQQGGDHLKDGVEVFSYQSLPAFFLNILAKKGLTALVAADTLLVITFCQHADEEALHQPINQELTSQLKASLSNVSRTFSTQGTPYASNIEFELVSIHAMPSEHDDDGQQPSSLVASPLQGGGKRGEEPAPEHGAATSRMAVTPLTSRVAEEAAL